MHIWHHAKDLPKGSHGVNYGLTLSIWDYLFGTAYIPHEGRDIPLGFDGVEQFPKTFWQQISYPFKKNKLEG
jgi:sterol desaturase/sphingolipid hydroxylase (fatty acid hydroxylase superfamily)